MAVCYSTAEYCAPVWARLPHALKVKTELNRACWSITGSLKAIPLQSLYRLAGIPPPKARREAISKLEKDKQLSDVRHPLHGHVPVPARLSSRRSFATVTRLGRMRPGNYRLGVWSDSDTSSNEALPEISEALPNGGDLSRRHWVTLNRSRAKDGKPNDNIFRWDLGVCRLPLWSSSSELRTHSGLLPIGPTSL